MRCFLAIDIPENIKNNINIIQDKLYKKDLVLVNKDLLHITIKFFRNIDIKVADEIFRNLQDFDFKIFDISLNGFDYFRFNNDSGILFININKNSENLSLLYEELERRCFFDYSNSHEKFIPHLTVARIKKFNLQLVEQIKEFNNFEFGSFQIKRLSFKKSTLTNKEPIYEELRSFDLE
ncbi:MAG: RNA 2',3'-cyclic phosphodiesterase [Candidatus Micrarchaeia archaeon]